MTADIHADESLRFEFGAIRRLFLSVLTDERIRMAEASLKDMLGVASLEGVRFLDIGCGSGLFQPGRAPARRRGLFLRLRSRVGRLREELKRRYFPGDPAWQVLPGRCWTKPHARSAPSTSSIRGVSSITPVRCGALSRTPARRSRRAAGCS